MTTLIRRTRLTISRAHFKSGAGFTLVELLITITIVGILATGISLSILNYQRQQALDLTAQELASNIRTAVSRSVTQKDGAQWGVYFKNNITNPDFYAVFSGSSYASSATTTITYLDSPIEFNTPSSGNATEITFTQLSGLPNAAATVILSNGAQTKTITVNDKGQVQY